MRSTHVAEMSSSPSRLTPLTAVQRARRVVVLTAAAAEIAAPWWVVRAGTDAFSRPDGAGDPPIIPAPYAFAIWGPIYGGMAGYAVRSLLAARAARFAHDARDGRDPRAALDATAWPAALAMAGAAAWVLVAQDAGRVWWTVVILATMAVALARANVALDRFPEASRGADRWLVRAPLGLFFGWCTAATFANLASALRVHGLTRPGAETVPTLLLLAGATLAAVVATRALRPNAWYTGAVTWALTAIGIANAAGVNRPRNLAVAAAASLGALAVLAAWRLPRRATTRGADPSPWS